jgi:hypothetical protein
MHKSSDTNHKELYAICVSSGSRNRINIISIITPRRMRWGVCVCVARCGTQGKEQNCILGFKWKPEEKHCFEETGTKAVILRWRFKKQNGIRRSTFIWLWRGTSDGSINRMVWNDMPSSG